MSFVVPTFNLLCNIGQGTLPFIGVTFPTGPPFASLRLPLQPCALVYGSRTNAASTGGTVAQGFPLQAMNLLLPAGTDVRGPESSAVNTVVGVDLVECPAGSGRWYSVYFVDDIGKGYANEHRSAGLFACLATWPSPAP